MYAYRPRAVEQQSSEQQNAPLGYADIQVPPDLEHEAAQDELPTLNAVANGYLPAQMEESSCYFMDGSESSAPAVGHGISQAELRERMKVQVPPGAWSKKGRGEWTPSSPSASTRAPTTKARGEMYANEHEDARNFRGDPATLSAHLETPDAHCTEVQTRMFSEQEANEHAVSVADGALMHQGKPMHTADASGKGTWALGGQGRYLYAKDTDGHLRAADAWKEHVETPLSDQPDETGSTPTRLQMTNHSTLVGGADVRGAGEIRADHGKHVVISDRSGHYKPDGSMLHDTVDGLVGQGLAPEATTVELTGKGYRGSGLVRKDNEGKALPHDPQLGDLQVGALEFLSYGGDVRAEDRIRSARNARSPVMADIQNFDPTTLNHASTRDRSAPRLESLSESIFRGDQPSVKNRIQRFSPKPKETAKKP